MLKDIITNAEKGILNEKTNSIISNISKNLSSNIDNIKDLPQDKRTVIFRNTKHNRDIQLGNNSIRFVLDKYIAEYLNLNLIDFKYQDEGLKDWGEKDGEMYHIFYSINDNYNIDEYHEILLRRSLMSVKKFNKHKIIICNILSNKLIEFFCNVDSSILRVLEEIK